MLLDLRSRGDNSSLTIVNCFCTASSAASRSLLFATCYIRLAALISFHLICSRINPLLLLSSPTIVPIAGIHHHDHLSRRLYHLACRAVSSGSSSSSSRAISSINRLSLLYRCLLLEFVRMKISLSGCWLYNFC